MRARQLIWRNLVRNRRNLFSSSLGIVLGVGALCFFLSLAFGVKAEVLDKVFVVDQLEVVPGESALGRLASGSALFSGGTGLDAQLAERIAEHPEVVAVYPKQRLAFPAAGNGGASILGTDIWFELVADGIPSELIALSDDNPETADDGRDSEASARALQDAFRDWGGDGACASSDECPAGLTCHDGVCAGASCVPDDEVWHAPTERAAEQVLRRLRRRQRIGGWEYQLRPLPQGAWAVALAPGEIAAARQTLTAATDLPGNATSPDEQGCATTPTYCVPDRRRCEMPVPFVVSQTLVELYRGNLRSVLSGSSSDLRRLRNLDPEAFIGLTFDGRLGEGFLGRARGAERGGSGGTQVLQRRFRLVGFSSKAISVGATVPLGYIQRWNERFHPDISPSDYHSLLVVAKDSRSLHRVAAWVTDELGLQIAPKYEASRKASHVLEIATLSLLLISLLISLLGAISIGHTFHMLISERRREIGILRAVGATRGRIYLMVLVEAAVVGVGGAIVAVALAYLASLGIDALFLRYVPDFPFRPDTLFAFRWWVWPLALGVGVLFAVLGAIPPARRASRLDPAMALRVR